MRQKSERYQGAAERTIKDIRRLAAYSMSQMPSPQSRVIQRDHPQQKSLS